jgi:hypothetical protein
LAFLLFQTEEKPFPFKVDENTDNESSNKGEVIEEELETETSEKTEDTKE